ncbi:MAG TPA: hydrogenase nickel incorporation protein HypB [Vicinamibacterales bacterium]|jgi:hydrogenase nickel incorporation protein HypB
MTPRIVEVRQNILKKNDQLAAALRARFRGAGVFVTSLVSSPGAGKTSFLERTLVMLTASARPAALVGDLATECDATRLRRSGAPVRQITTGTVCHLDAAMVDAALSDWDLAEIDHLFIENVGNLVCPASYDLGEQLRVVLLSVTEGEDKPLKYPTIFNTADVAVITKIDLAAAVDFDGAAVRRNIDNVRPGLPVLEVSARTGEGMEAWIQLLESFACEWQGASGRRERATRPERAGVAASEGGCKGVRGAKPLG